MHRPRRIPQPYHHKPSGRAAVCLPDGMGGRPTIYLGPYGSPESEAEYKRVIAEWLANDCTLPRTPATRDIAITELIDRFWSHVETYYRTPDGAPGREQEDYKLSLRPLKHLYGHTPAQDFGPFLPGEGPHMYSSFPSFGSLLLLPSSLTLQRCRWRASRSWRTGPCSTRRHRWTSRGW